MIGKLKHRCGAQFTGKVGREGGREGGMSGGFAFQPNDDLLTYLSFPPSLPPSLRWKEC